MTADADRQLTLADRVLDLVRAAAGRRAEAEVLVEYESLALTRFANSFIHQNVADATTTVRLRVHLDGRTASGSTTLTVDDALRDLVQRTLSASRFCPPDRTWPGLTLPAEALTGGNADRPTATATPADRAAKVRDFVDAAAGLETAGYCRTRHQVAAYANSAGHAVTGATTEAAMDGIARTGSSDGVARTSVVQLAGVDGTLLGGRAAAKARAAAHPVELPPGRYEVVLEPCAVKDVLANLAHHGFNGRVYAERRSFARLGAPQFDPTVTIVEDVTRPDASGLPFDIEGTPRGRLPLVDAGTTSAVALDRRTAAIIGAQSTGCALPDSVRWGPMPSSLHLEPGAGNGAVGDGSPAADASVGNGSPAADASVAALLGRVGRGLLISDLWYTRVLDTRSLVVTGLTRNGVWLIENGEVTRPVANLRFTQSYPAALAPGAVLALGGRASRTPSDWDLGAFSGPALHLASWNFTGGASG